MERHAMVSNVSMTHVLESREEVIYMGARYDMVRHVRGRHIMVRHTMIGYVRAMHVRIWCLRLRYIGLMHVWADMSERARHNRASHLRTINMVRHER
jgi:hypothetical protein